jgi:Fe2+ or Zn2+ uptake regulation protein
MDNIDEENYLRELQIQRAAYNAEKAEREAYEDECPHDEHDHGICLECGKDIMDDLVGRAEMLRDEMEDR